MIHKIPRAPVPLHSSAYSLSVSIWFPLSSSSECSGMTHSPDSCYLYCIDALISLCCCLLSISETYLLHLLGSSSLPSRILIYTFRCHPHIGYHNSSTTPAPLSHLHNCLSPIHHVHMPSAHSSCSLLFLSLIAPHLNILLSNLVQLDQVGLSWAFVRLCSKALLSMLHGIWKSNGKDLVRLLYSNRLIVRIQAKSNQPHTHPIWTYLFRERYSISMANTIGPRWSEAGQLLSHWDPTI